MTETLPNNCDGCGAPVTRWLPDEPPDRGLSFDISGSYAGFTDNFQRPVSFAGRIDICHDCVVRLVELFPILRLKFGVACHPCEDEKPCCAHSFSPMKKHNFLRVPNADLTGWVEISYEELKGWVV
jgi:hypothetical protein